MIDIHSHVLPGIDDGADSMETALEMLAMAADSGVDTLVTTPHCNIPGEFDNYVSEELKELWQRLESETRRARIPVRLCQGMEIFATRKLPELLEHRELFEVVRNALPQRREKLYDAVCYSFYRSAYSSSKELLKYGFSGSKRRGKIREICTRYRQEGIRPRDGKTLLISIPIRWSLAWVIDGMIKAAAKIR